LFYLIYTLLGADFLASKSARNDFFNDFPNRITVNTVALLPTFQGRSLQNCLALEKNSASAGNIFG
jgi:hypothetical protein